MNTGKTTRCEHPWCSPEWRCPKCEPDPYKAGRLVYIRGGRIASMPESGMKEETS